MTNKARVLVLVLTAAFVGLTTLAVLIIHGWDAPVHGARASPIHYRDFTAREVDPVHVVVQLSTNDDSTTAAVVSDAPDASELHLIVVDCDSGAPVRGACALIETSVAVIAAQVTATDGRATLRYGREAGASTLLVRAPSYALYAAATPSADHDVVVRLSLGAAIAGTVTLPTGSPAQEGLLVVAVPPGYNLSPIDIDRGRSRYHACLTARTDSAGHFVLGSLRPGMDYYLVAGGEGVATAGQVGPFTAPTENAQVPVAALYGFVVEFVGERNQPILAASDLYGWPYPSMIVATPGTMRVQVDSPYAVLAGIPQSVPENSGSRRHTVLLLCDGEPERLGPFQFCQGIPGYGPARVELWAYPVKSGVRRFEVEVSPQGDGQFGVVLVDLRTMGSTDEILGTLRFLGTPAQEVVYSYPLRASPGRPVVIDGVPAGDYHVHFECKGGMVSLPRAGPVAVTVPPHGDVSVTVDLREAGAWRCTVECSCTTMYTPRVAIRVTRREDNATVLATNIVGTACYWPVFPEGTYVVESTYVADDVERRMRPATFDVVAGRETQVVLREER